MSIGWREEKGREEKGREANEFGSAMVAEVCDSTIAFWLSCGGAVATATSFYTPHEVLSLEVKCGKNPLKHKHLAKQTVYSTNPVSYLGLAECTFLFPELLQYAPMLFNSPYHVSNTTYYHNINLTYLLKNNIMP